MNLSARGYALAPKPMVAFGRVRELVTACGHANCGGNPHALTNFAVSIPEGRDLQSVTARNECERVSVGRTVARSRYQARPDCNSFSPPLGMVRREILRRVSGYFSH